MTSRTRSCRGSDAIHVGVRWSIVTSAPASASEGTSVTAVAPDPMTTTLRPVTSRSSGQNCGCTTSPSKDSSPGSCGSCGRS